MLTKCASGSLSKYPGWFLAAQLVLQKLSDLFMSLLGVREQTVLISFGEEVHGICGRVDDWGTSNSNGVRDISTAGV